MSSNLSSIISSEKKPHDLLAAQVNTENLLHDVPRYGHINARNGRSTLDPRGMSEGLREMVMKKKNIKDPNSLVRSAHVPSVWHLLSTGRGIGDDSHDDTDKSLQYYGSRMQNPEHKTFQYMSNKMVQPHAVNHHNQEHSSNVLDNIIHDVYHGTESSHTNIHT